MAGDGLAGFDMIDYAIFARADGHVLVYESGVNMGDVGTYVSGDVLGVSRVGTTISYTRNGGVLQTSAVPSSGDLVADAAMHQTGAGISGARIFGTGP